MSRLIDHEEAHRCPLLMSMVKDMARGSSEVHSEKTLPEDTWAELREERIWEIRGTKSAISRFLSGVHQTAKEVEQVSKRGFSTLIVAWSSTCWAPQASRKL